MLPGAVDALAIDKCAVRRGRDRARVVRVHKIDVVNVRRVQNIYVSNECVVDIDDIDEAAAAVEPREERFTPAKREPAGSEAKTPAPAAAEETNESGSIDRRAKERARAPTPRATDVGPAAVVVRSKTPRLVAHPRPAPRINPVPGTVTVGRPVGGHVTGIPDVAVFGFVAPSAVVVQVVVARHIA